MVDRRRSKRWAVGRIAGFSAWTALVALFLLWQSATYRGLMSLIGEWQFNGFGRHYPTFNYILLVFLLCLPGYLLFLRPRERRPGEAQGSAVLRSAGALLKALLGVGAALAVAVLAVLVVMLFLPRDSGEVQRIDVARPAVTPPREGPTILSGRIIYERTAGFDEDLLVARRSFRFAPVVGPQDVEEGRIRFFVQFAPVDDRARADVSELRGVLKRNGLPGEVVRLFRYAGYELEQPHYVLFAEPAAMRWPYLATMAQFAVGALLALLFALLQRGRIRRLGGRPARPAEAAPG